jgi:Na+-translocating ferredoxin:NAD+ oxidoreductase subunit A
MSALLLILLSAVLVCHYAPTIPALNPFISRDHFESVSGIALASALTLIVVSPLSYVIEHAVLEPRGLGQLRTLIFVILVMAVAQLASFAMRLSKRWIPAPQAFLLLMTSNSAVLGVAFLNTTRSRSFGDSLLLGMGTGLAFAALLLMFTALQQRLRYANMPALFRDTPAALVTVGLMALACMGFTGLIRE